MNVSEEMEVKVFIKQVNQVKGFKSGGRADGPLDEEVKEPPRSVSVTCFRGTRRRA